jgi:hypothetical protein
MIRPIHTAILLLGAILFIAGCQTQPVKPTGYLVDYNQLKPTDSSSQTLYFEDTQAPWKSYHSIMFDEVIIRVAEGEDERKIDAEDLQKMRNYFQQALANTSCMRLGFTNEPGEGVILLRTAIVDIKPVNVAVNVVSKGLFFIPVDFGKASIEGELRDSVTGQRLASIVDRKIGSLVKPSHSYTTWGAAKGAFDDWSEQLGEILDRNIGAEAKP